MIYGGDTVEHRQTFHPTCMPDPADSWIKRWCQVMHTEQMWTMRETPDAKRSGSPTTASEIHEGQDVTVDDERTKKFRLTLTILSTFKIVLVFLSNIMTNSVERMSLAELMKSMIIFPEASLTMNCMFSPPRCNSRFRNVLHLFKIRCFCTRYTSVPCLLVRPTWCSLGTSFEVPGLFWTWSNVHTWCSRAWTFRSKLHFFSPSCRKCALPPFGSFEEIGISFIIPTKVTRWGRFLVYFCQSSPLPCSVHSSILSIISFVLLPRKIWNMKWNFLRQFSVRLPCSTWDVFSHLAELDSWHVHRLHTLTKKIWEDVSFGVVHFWHFLSCGPLVSRALCSSDLKRCTRSGRSCPLHSLWKAFFQGCLSSWVSVELMITQLIHGHEITQNAIWLCNLWRVLIPHLINTLGLCHHLRQQRLLVQRRNLQKAVQSWTAPLVKWQSSKRKEQKSKHKLEGHWRKKQEPRDFSVLGKSVRENLSISTKMLYGRVADNLIKFEQCDGIRQQAMWAQRPLPEAAMAEVWSVAEENGHCNCIGHTLLRSSPRTNKRASAWPRTIWRIKTVNRKSQTSWTIKVLKHGSWTDLRIMMFFSFQNSVSRTCRRIKVTGINAKNCKNTEWCRRRTSGPSNSSFVLWSRVQRSNDRWVSVRTLRIHHAIKHSGKDVDDTWQQTRQFQTCSSAPCEKCQRIM